MENEQLPQQENTLDNFFNIAFDESTRMNVRTAAQWARIAAICAFIGYAVSLIVVFFGRTASLSESEEGLRVSTLARTSSILGALISVGIGVLVNYFLYRFATRTVQGMDAMDNIKTNEGFNSLRVYFKIYGIILIIVLSFCVLAVFFVFIAGAARY